MAKQNIIIIIQNDKVKAIRFSCEANNNSEVVTPPDIPKQKTNIFDEIWVVKLNKYVIKKNIPYAHNS